MTNLSAEQGLLFYEQRMKIEETFNDLKSLLGLDKLMCQKRYWMEQMVCLALIAFAIGLAMGKTLHSQIFPKTNQKNKLYSGLFGQWPCASLDRPVGCDSFVPCELPNHLLPIP